MILYFEKTGDLMEAPARNPGDGIKYPEPMPKKKVYEYIEPTYNPETQTLDGITVVDNIATNVVIPFPNWEFSDCHCRIWALQSDCEAKKEGALADFCSDLTSQMYIAGKDTSHLLIVDGLVYYLFYATFLKVEDGFYLEDGVIKVDDKSKLYGKVTIDQYTSFSERGEVLIQDNL